MIVWKWRDPADPTSGFDDDYMEALCFFCGDRLFPPFVHWYGMPVTNGSQPVIALHPPCLVELAIRMLRDVQQIKSASGEKVTRDPREWGKSYADRQKPRPQP